MDLNRLRLGEMVAAAGAALLFLIMFLPWFSFDIPHAVPSFARSLANVDVSTSANAWDALPWWNVGLMLITIVAALGLAALVAAGRTVALPVSWSVVVTALGILITLVTLYRLINQPGPNSLVSDEWGAYLGFLACASIAVGGWLSMRQEGVKGMARPQIPVRPAPPVGGVPVGAPAQAGAEWWQQAPAQPGGPQPAPPGAFAPQPSAPPPIADPAVHPAPPETAAPGVHPSPPPAPHGDPMHQATPPQGFEPVAPPPQPATPQVPQAPQVPAQPPTAPPPQGGGLSSGDPLQSPPGTDG